MKYMKGIIKEKTCNYSDLIVLLKLRTRYFLTN